MLWFFIFGIGFVIGSYTTEMQRYGDIWQEVEANVKAFTQEAQRLVEENIEENLIPRSLRRRLVADDSADEDQSEGFPKSVSNLTINVDHNSLDEEEE